ncbi:unnamed protein product, partial [Rotaria sordida]
MGTEQKHWAKEVVQRTKTRDNIRNTQFVQKKINRLMNNISKVTTTITDLQIQLSTYWMQTNTEGLVQRLVKTTAEATTNMVIDKINKSKKSSIEKGAEPATSPTITIPITVVTEQGTTTTATPATTTAAPTTNKDSTIFKNQIREPVERIEKCILDYVYKCTEHVKKGAQIRLQLANVQMEEFKALEDFEQIATAQHWNVHLIMKPKIKLWTTKNKNHQTILKRIEYYLPSKFISKIDFTFKIDESILGQQESQALYDEMRRLTKNFRIEAMTKYEQGAAREKELLTIEINRIVESFSQNTNEDEISFAAFKQYHDLRMKRLNLEIEQSMREILAPNVINEAQVQLTEDEYELLKLGPRFIYNDPKTASRRRITELATLKRKIEARFFEEKVSPGRPVEQFIAELDILLHKLHNTPVNYQKLKTISIQNNTQNIIYDNLVSTIESSQSQDLNSQITIKKKKNYGRLIKRLKHKLHLKNIVLQKSDKNKVFHLGKLENYHKKSEEYMDKTKVYKCLGTEDPLPDLIRRTNKYPLDLRLAKWITQKQYEKLCINSNEVELAHLYYLPKAHKPGTPLRPIISRLKHPTVKVSKFLDELLRPLFDKMALKSTVTSGFELVKQLQNWSKDNMRQETLFCTIDVADLYTMVPQTEGVLSLKKMLDHLKLKQVSGLKIETIIRLSRFVMQNNYFSYEGQYYH